MTDPRHTLILLAYLRQRQVAAELALIESFAPAPPPADPVTDEEQIALRRIRDAALAKIERARDWRARDDHRRGTGDVAGCCSDDSQRAP